MSNTNAELDPRAILAAIAADRKADAMARVRACALAHPAREGGPRAPRGRRASRPRGHRIGKGLAHGLPPTHQTDSHSESCGSLQAFPTRRLPTPTPALGKPRRGPLWPPRPQCPFVMHRQWLQVFEGLGVCAPN